MRFGLSVFTALGVFMGSATLLNAQTTDDLFAAEERAHQICQKYGERSEECMRARGIAGKARCDVHATNPAQCKRDVARYVEMDIARHRADQICQEDGRESETCMWANVEVYEVECRFEFVFNNPEELARYVADCKFRKAQAAANQIFCRGSKQRSTECALVREIVNELRCEAYARDPDECKRRVAP